MRPGTRACPSLPRTILTINRQTTLFVHPEREVLLQPMRLRAGQVAHQTNKRIVQSGVRSTPLCEVLTIVRLWKILTQLANLNLSWNLMFYFCRTERKTELIKWRGKKQKPVFHRLFLNLNSDPFFIPCRISPCLSTEIITFLCENESHLGRLWHLSCVYFTAQRQTVHCSTKDAYTSETTISEIRELQRSINTYNIRYFPQHVLLCTSTVHDQSGDICIQGYLRILWIGNAISLKIDNIHKRYVLW